MERSHQRSITKASALLLLVTSPSCSPQAPARPLSAHVAEQLRGLAVPFIDDAGQSDPRVAYYAPTSSGTVFVTRLGEIVYALPGPGARRREPAPATGWTLTESFVDGHAAPTAAERATTRVSIIHGNDPARWRRQVATFADVDLGTVWPGIAVTLKAYGGEVEKIFTVSPGAVPETIRVRVTGAEGLTVAPDGGLVVHTGVGDVRLTRPVAYQETGGMRQMVDHAYAIGGDEYGFRLAGYDPARPVVIDPLLQATYLGGSNRDGGILAIAPLTGEVYVAGFTWSTDFPGTGGGAQSAFGGNVQDAFVARLNASLTALDQATYLGGSGNDGAVALMIGPTGEVYVAGQTTSTDFPGTSGGAQSTFGGTADAFVARLNASLTALDQATYLGGSDNDNAPGLAIAPTTGEVYVAGYTASTDFPGTSGGAQGTFGGGPVGAPFDAFVARLNASLTALDQATYLGGGNYDAGNGLTIAPTTGVVYVGGITASTNFPGTPGGAQSALGGSYDGFVARLNTSLTALEQATYLGGTSSDSASALAIATTGEVYAAGGTMSTNFPGTSGGLQSVLGGTADAFVVRLNASLTALHQATYLGGSDGDSAGRLAIAPTTGEVYVAGGTGSTDFPGVRGGAQSTFAGGLPPPDIPSDAFIARLDASLTALDQATYLGGSGNDGAGALAIASTGEVYVAGGTSSTDFPGTSGGARSTFGGGVGEDAFVARLSADLRAPIGHLACYRTMGARNTVRYTFDLMAGVSGFPNEPGCKLKLASKRICVEVDKQNVAPPPPGGGPTPAPNAGSVFLAYKLNCPAATVPPTAFADQFGPGVFAVGRASEVLVPALPGPSNDHLECYKTKDPRPRAGYTLDLTAGVAGFTDELGCTVRRGAKMVCVQVTKQNVMPPPPGGGPAPGGSASGAKLVSYRIKCPTTSLPSVTVTDQFGAGTFRPTRVATLLVPASPSGAFLGPSAF